MRASMQLPRPNQKSPRARAHVECADFSRKKRSESLSSATWRCARRAISRRAPRRSRSRASRAPRAPRAAARRTTARSDGRAAAFSKTHPRPQFTDCTEAASRNEYFADRSDRARSPCETVDVGGCLRTDGIYARGVDMDALPHLFRDPALLQLALTHASMTAERDNERLEFLGDA